MCQVHIGAYVSLLTPGETDYTARHPRETTTYILYVVSITAHTHDRRKSIKKKNQIKGKKTKGRKEKTKKRNKKITRKERKEKETTRKARKDKRRRGSKERKREE